MTADAHIPLPVRTAASRWAQKLAEGLTAAERTGFDAWLKEHPSHRRAFALANREGVDCDWIWQADAAGEVLQGLAAKARRRRRRGAAAAAFAAVLLLGGAMLWQRPTWLAPSEVAAAPAHVAVVQPKRLTLLDGSVVELKDDARVRVDYTLQVRTVIVDRGTAFFQVARNPARPFVVRAGSLSVQAVGTAFAVGLAENAMTVAVTEGRVRVDPAPPLHAATSARTAALVSVGAGDAVVIPTAVATASNIRHIEPSDWIESTAWRIPKLQFAAAPVREVLGVMNRYGPVRVDFEDDAIGDLRVSGVLRADKTEVLLHMLETDFGVQAVPMNGRTLLRRAR